MNEVDNVNQDMLKTQLWCYIFDDVTQGFAVQSNQLKCTP